MKNIGTYSRVDNDVKPSEQVQNYDVDHEITAMIAEIDNVINSCNLGYSTAFEVNKNENLIIKACINHLLEKL
jgi:hypothetical protein